MKYRRFGRKEWQVSEIGYGMWGMGEWSGSDDDQSLDAVFTHEVETVLNDLRLIRQDREVQALGQGLPFFLGIARGGLADRNRVFFVAADDHTVGAHKIFDCRSFAQKFWIRRNAEIRFCFQIFRDKFTKPFARADGNC